MAQCIYKLGLSYVLHVHTTVHVNVDPSMVRGNEIMRADKSQKTLHLNNN